MKDSYSDPNRPVRSDYYLEEMKYAKNILDMKEKIQQDVDNAIKNLEEKDLSIENIINYHY
jgi:hypothetical protein